MPSRLFYINKGLGLVNQTIDSRQNGKCRDCGKNFTPDEQIVSNGKRKKYYHVECAQRLNILILLPKGLANKKSKPAFNLQESRSNLLPDLNKTKQVALV
jgi:hypothetical protein